MNRLFIVAGLILAFVFVPYLCMRLFVRHAAPAQLDHDGELIAWQLLKDSGVRATATVTDLRRHELRLTRAGSYGNNEVAAVELDLGFQDAQGGAQSASVRTFIDVETLANFAQGRIVQIVYDPANPQSLAIDRNLNPTELPPVRE